MKVLMINVVCGIRSTGRICVEQAQKLEAEGHEVKIAYGREKVPAEYEKYAVRIGTDADVYLHALKARILDKAGFGSRKATERFIEWVRTYDPDEIHLHNLHGYYINIEVLFEYLKTCGKKITWTLHDCWAFTGHCTHYMVPQCDKWKTGCSGSCPQCHVYPRSWFVNASGENYAKKKALFQGIPDLSLITPSAWLAESVKLSYLKEYPVTVRHNDIDHDAFVPTQSDFRDRYGLAGKQILLGVASTWTKNKGWYDYLRLAGHLKDDQRLVLVGVNGRQKRRLPKNVIGIEQTNSKKELAEIYTAADLFVNLTYEDNYPSVNLEAKACGTRIITYDTGGCRETIDADDILVKTGAFGEILRAITRQAGTEAAEHLKVLMINVVCGIRSTGRICTDLAQKLEEEGHEVKIAYGRENVPERYQKYAVRIGNEIDIYLHALKARILDAAGFGSIRATKRFLRWVEEYDPDVIHLHNLHGYYINIELLFNYLRTSGKKVIWTLHDCWAFTGHCTYFDYCGCERWQEACGNCPQRAEYPRRWFTDHSHNNFLRKRKAFTGIPSLELVTPSDWLGRLVERSFLKEYSVHVIHNDVDTAVFKPTESDFRRSHQLEDKKIILGVASIWDKRKGLQDVLELAGLLDDTCRIVLVGKLPNAPQLPENVLFIGKTDSQKTLAELYTAADVLINPTYEDNYPTVNLEAIACGTPVITYDTGGSGESAVLYGRVIPKGDVRQMKDQILEITETDLPDTGAKTLIQDMIRRYRELYDKAV